MDPFDVLPVLASAFAIPQYLPQIHKLRATSDTAGVSWAWATLAALHNGAWLVYFTLSGYWTSMLPSSSAAVLGTTLAVMLAARGGASVRAALPIIGWAIVLAAGFVMGGKDGLGNLLTAASIVQVTPSLMAAYRTARPTGISRGTWLLVLAELSCWTCYGLHRLDPRVIVLGVTGVTASLLMLLRIHRTRAAQPL